MFRFCSRVSVFFLGLVSRGHELSRFSMMFFGLTLGFLNEFDIFSKSFLGCCVCFFSFF